MKKNAGFTVIELVISFVLISFMVVFFFNIILNLKDKYLNTNLETQLLNKQALMSKEINDAFRKKNILMVSKCGANCLNFIYDDHTSDQLKIDSTNNIFKFGDYTTNLIDNSSFGDISIKNTTIPSVAMGKNDSIIEIKIAVRNSTLNKNFDINIAYQYDSRTTSIGNIVFDDSNDSEDALILKGNVEETAYTTIAYTDAGYLLFDESGNSVETSDLVEISNPLDTLSVPYEPGTYEITYTLKDSSGNILDTKTRTVYMIKSVYEFNHVAQAQSFVPPQAGIYKIELWGAQGNNPSSNLISGGLGAYTKGEIALNQTDTLFVYVGEHRTDHEVSFNAGSIGGDIPNSSNSEISGYGGGGATDIRLTSGNWDDIVSLKSRIMVAAGGGGASNYTYPATGGYGGTLTGGSGNNGRAPENTVANIPPTGGTQTSGGSTSVLVAENLTTSGVGSAGTFGIGGSSVGYGSGGGGGYYGGGSGGYTHMSIDSGAGGSSFISGHIGCDAIDIDGNHTGANVHYSNRIFTNTVMKAGNETMPNPLDNTNNITGKDGDGFARITLISITQTN